MVLGLLQEFSEKILYQDQVCAWFSLVRLPTQTARKLLLDHFLKETALFLLLASQTCSMPRQDFFVPYLLPSHVNCYPNSQTIPPF